MKGIVVFGVEFRVAFQMRSLDCPADRSWFPSWLDRVIGFTVAGRRGGRTWDWRPRADVLLVCVDVRRVELMNVE